MEFLQQAGEQVFQSVVRYPVDWLCCSENDSIIATKFALPLLRMFLGLFLGVRAEEIANLTLCFCMNVFQCIFAATRLIAVAAYVGVLTLGCCVDHFFWLFARGSATFYSAVILQLPSLLWKALCTTVPILVNAVPFLGKAVFFSMRMARTTLRCLTTSIAWEIRENETIQGYVTECTNKLETSILAKFFTPLGLAVFVVLYVILVIFVVVGYKETFDYSVHLWQEIVSPRTKDEQLQPADTLDPQGHKYSILVSRASRLDHYGRALAEARQRRFNTEECMFCYDTFGTMEDLKATSKGGTLRLLRCGHVFDECCWTEYTKSGNGFWGQCPICKERAG